MMDIIKGITKTRLEARMTQQADMNHTHQIGEYHRVCGSAVGVIFATDTSAVPQIAEGSSLPRALQVHGEVPVVCHVVDACCRAQLTEVFVVTVPEMSDGVSREVHRAKRKKNSSDVQVVALDQWALDDRAREAADIELFGLNFAELELAGGLAGTVLGGYERVVVVSGDNVDLTADDVYDACLRAIENPELMAAAAGESGAPREPYVFASGLFDDLENSARQLQNA